MGGHAPTAAATKRQLIRALAVFAPAYTRWIAAAAPEGNLSFARLRVLLLLRGEPCTMSHVRAELGITATSVTQLVDGLEREALLRRLAHPVDRRSTLLELTDRGREIVDSSYATFEATAGDLFRNLSVSDRGTLLRIVSELCEELAGRGIELPRSPLPD